MLVQYLKHLAVHTPLERAAKTMRVVAALVDHVRSPELAAIHDEPRYLDAACRLLLTPEANTIDVGAHLGSQLSMFVDLAPQGSHMAFEPVPQKARWLRSKFPGVDVRQIALCNTAGEGKFFVNVTQPGYSGLRPHAAANDVLRRIVVQQSTLDASTEPRQEVDMIKLDVEGAELFVLQGAEQLLARCRPTLLFESTRSAMQPYGLTPDSMYTFLSERGYRVFLPRSFVNGGLPLEREEFAEAHEYPFLAFNFIACAPERALGRRRRRAQRAAPERLLDAARKSA